MPIVPSGVRSSMKSRITRGEERGRRKGHTLIRRKKKGRRKGRRKGHTLISDLIFSNRLLISSSFDIFDFIIVTRRLVEE